MDQQFKDDWHNNPEVDPKRATLIDRRICIKAVEEAAEHFEFADLLLPLVPEHHQYWLPHGSGYKYFPRTPEETDYRYGCTMETWTVSGSLIIQDIFIHHPLDLIRPAQINEYDERCRWREEYNGNLPTVRVDLSEWWAQEGEMVVAMPARTNIDMERRSNRKFKVIRSL